MKSLTYLRSGISAFALIAICTAAFAAPANFKEAVSEYSAGKYKIALDKFIELEKTNGKNATLHYYSAMCYQNLGQMNEARTEYQFVLTNGDPTLQGYAQRALATLGKKSAPSASSSAYNGTGMGVLSVVTPDQSRVKPVPPPQGPAAKLR